MAKENAQREKKLWETGKSRVKIRKKAVTGAAEEWRSEAFWKHRTYETLYSKTTVLSVE